MRSMVGLLFLVILCNSISAGVREIKNANNGTDATVAVWVYFIDKPFNASAKSTVSSGALARRAVAGYNRNELSDRAVSQQYVAAVCAAGGKLRHTNKWENAASFTVDVSMVPAIKRLQCVKDLTLVGISSIKRGGNQPLSKVLATGTSQNGYGSLYLDLEKLRVPAAHRYISKVFPSRTPGEGVRIAVFDNGFRLDHRCFNQLNRRNGIVAKRNFVDDTTGNDTNVFTTDSHGTHVVSVIAGYDPPYFTGTAWGADFILARTESDDYELHVEEDNWAAAVIWAEENGADIISSSVGYREFDSYDTVIIMHPDSTLDTLTDYRVSDLDGNSTIISRAARGAVERGVIVVNAVGNEQVPEGTSTLCAPADVDGVIAVGAIDTKFNIAAYSSSGPTADGRVKPDVLAPGTVWVLRLTSPNDTVYDVRTSGTSLSAPLIAGVAALVKQCYPLITADSLRNRIYRFCRYVNKQYAIDNIHGRGMPDATSSCMQDDEVFVNLVDTSGLPVTGAVLTVGDARNAIAATDSNGYAFVRAPDAVGSYLEVTKYQKTRRLISHLTLPYYRSVYPCTLEVTLVDDEGTRLVNRDVQVLYGNEQSAPMTDSSGTAYFVRFFPDEVRFFASYPGYLATDTMSATLGDSLQFKKVTMKSKPIEFTFIVYPTVLHRSRSEELFIHYQPSTATLHKNDASIIAMVQSLDGTLVWKKKVSDNISELISWNGTNGHGSRCSPGIYFATVKHGRKIYRKKVIIAE